VLLAIFASAEPGVLRRVNTPKPNPIALDLERIAVNDCWLANQVVSLGNGRHDEQ